MADENGTDSGDGGSGTDSQNTGQDQQQSGSDDLAGLRSALDSERAQRRAFEKDAKRAKELENELDRYRQANQSETEKLIEKARREAGQEARAELSTQFSQRLVTAEVRAAASGKLQDPADAVRLLDGSEFIGKDGDPDRKAIDRAITQLLAEKPYLGMDKGPPSFDGGQRTGKTGGTQRMDDVIRRQIGITR